MSTKRKYADTDDSTSDVDNSDNTDDDQEVEDESDPWAPLEIEVAEKNLTDAMVLKKNKLRTKHI